MPINKLLLITILILTATAILVFVREIPSRIAHGEQGRIAIYTLDEVRRPFLAIQAAEVMFLKNEYDEEVRTGLESEMENGNRLIAHYKDVAAYDAELLHRVELLASAYEEWLRAVSLMLAIPEQPDSRNVDVMHAADIVTASGFSDVMRLLGGTEDPVHKSIEEGARAVTELLIIGGVLLAGVLFSIFFLMNSRNRLLGDMLAQQELAEKELQKSHDQLELGVVERTQALTEEIQERRTIEAELLDRTELLQLVSSITIIANEVGLSSDSIETCLEKICAYTGWQVGHVYALSPSNPDKLVPSDIWYLNGSSNFLSFREITEKTVFKKGVGLPGRVLASGKLEWIDDVTKDDNFPRAKQGRDIGVRTGIGLPIKIRGKVVAVMEFFSSEPLKQDILFLRSLEQIGTQIGRLHERAEARGVLLDAKDKAETANRAKSDFLSSMSHELRTPLNAVIGFSGMIKEEIFGPLGNDQYRGYMDDIHNSGQHLLELINDVLDVSAIEAGALELQEDNVSLTDTIKASIHFIKHRADGGRVNISTAIDPEIPPVYADGRRVKQVLLNLLSNAVKFTPEEGEVSVTARLNDDGSLSLTVADTGFGMDEEEIETALSRFGQVDTGDRKHEGTGLGLPLTKGLMELHGGTLEIQSEKGHGTRITVTFPEERIGLNIC